MLFSSQKLTNASKLNLDIHWHDLPLTKDLISELKLLYYENLVTMLNDYPDFKDKVYESSQLYKKYTPEEIHRLGFENIITRVANGQNRLLLARIEGVLVGFARVCPTFIDTIDGLKVPSCFVGGAATKRVVGANGKRLSFSIGSKMAQFLVKTYQESVSTITCCTFAGHQYNRSLYLSHGAQALPDNEGFAGEEENRLFTSFRWKMKP